MSVRVVCGANSQNVEFAGKTVGEVRGYLAQTLNIPTGAQSLVTGHAVGDDHVLADGEQVEFVRESGRKG